MKKVLVVDDDSGLRQAITSALVAASFLVDQAVDGEEAVNKFISSQYDLVLMDVNMPKMNGLDALRSIKDFDPSAIVIILTAFSNVRDAIQAVKLGAYNYLEKPLKPEDLIALIDRALKAHRMVENLTFSAPVLKLGDNREFVGHSTGMKRIFSVIEKLTHVDTPVLIRGESGTGKELVAKAIHFNSPRKDERIVCVNCSAIPENLIESEFFGHEKGSFTGADSRKIGKFQFADGGTLFLDEIGDISPAMQVKLLRVLQEKKFTPLGSNREVEVNVRIIAATNRNLEEMVNQGSFREDLYYRLNVLPIFLPPLRERRDDINHLVKYFIDKFNIAQKKNITGISAEATEMLSNYNWPGNIRELENVIEHAFVIESGTEISKESLPSKIATSQNVDRTVKSAEPVMLKASLPSFAPLNPNLPAAAPVSQPLAQPTPNGSGDTLVFNLDTMDFQVSKDDFEKQFIITALKKYRGKINQTARGANIPKKTLLRKLEKYQIIAKEFTQ